ncbi:hypothetical protein DYB32_007351 [Aphanomyces invadans]|uniref:Uncharacterized protein n=1 Tax=Aphanomyces invadans TaxID=157072 RepID=A0A418AP65_9STRA|nr:hypothetical protein DYB32_007351 [Aphanomyces invadans]
MVLTTLTSHVQSYLRTGYMDTLHSYRSTGRFLLAIMAGNMMLQSAIVGVHVVQSVATTHNDGGDLGGQSNWLPSLLLLCQIAWVVASTVGGVAGFCAAYRFHIPSATLCLRSWIVLACIQAVQYLALCAMLASPEHQTDKGQLNATLAWESVVLIAIEGVFVLFVHSYIVVLQEWERQRTNEDGEGICLVPLHPVQGPTDNMPTYGTTTCTL